MATKQTIRDLTALTGARLFVRVDFNVPMEGTTITEDTRIRAALETLTFLRAAGAELVLASHLGRPKKGPTPALSLAPVAKRLSELLECDVDLAADCIGEDVRRRAQAMKPGSVLLLENVRFHPEEEGNDAGFAKALIADSGATLFVNDAFGPAHRAHASAAGVAPFVTRRVAGFLMEKEIHYLGLALASPPHPYVAIIGGAKVSDKITVIENLLPKVDRLLIGGGMAYTFFKAKGLDTGKSLVEAEKVGLAKSLLEKGANANTASANGVTPLYGVLNVEWAPKALYPQPRAHMQQKTGYLELMQQLVDKAPMYERPWIATPARAEIDAASLPAPKDIGAVLEKLVGCPDLASKRWVWEQYDHLVRGNTVQRPGGDAAVVRIEGCYKALAIATDAKIAQKNVL